MASLRHPNVVQVGRRRCCLAMLVWGGTGDAALQRGPSRVAEDACMPPNQKG